MKYSSQRLPVGGGGGAGKQCGDSEKFHYHERIRRAIELIALGTHKEAFGGNSGGMDKWRNGGTWVPLGG